MLQRSDWYDFARDTNWTPACVSQGARIEAVETAPAQGME